MVKLELTEEELNFIYDRCSSKAARLEDSNLEDTPCYRLAHQVMHKIYNLLCCRPLILRLCAAN